MVTEFMINIKLSTFFLTLLFFLAILKNTSIKSFKITSLPYSLPWDARLINFFLLPSYFYKQVLTSSANFSRGNIIPMAYVPWPMSSVKVSLLLFAVIFSIIFSLLLNSHLQKRFPSCLFLS